eukprot:7888_1
MSESCGESKNGVSDLTSPILPKSAPERGKLMFDCDFESGNLGEATQIDKFEWELKIRGDTENSRYKVWFYFRVRNSKRNQRVVFHICNYSKTKTLFREGFTPVVRSTSRWHWTRIPPSQIFYYRCSRHKKRYCFSVTFMFDNEQDEYYFAYSFPYTYTDLQKFLFGLDSKKLSFYKRELLCRTIQHRRLDIITITDDSSKRLRQKGAVVITARVHPGETPASFVVQGLLQFLTSSDQIAENLRQSSVFFIIPMLNPDGTFLGNYRYSASVACLHVKVCMNYRGVILPGLISIDIGEVQIFATIQPLQL